MLISKTIWYQWPPYFVLSFVILSLAADAPRALMGNRRSQGRSVHQNQVVLLHLPNHVAENWYHGNIYLCMYIYIYTFGRFHLVRTPPGILPLISSFQSNGEVEVGRKWDRESHHELDSSAGLENTTGLPVGWMCPMGVTTWGSGTVIKRRWWIYWWYLLYIVIHEWYLSIYFVTSGYINYDYERLLLDEYMTITII